MTFPTFEKMQHGYAVLWQIIEPRPEHAQELRQICTDLILRKSTYRKVIV
jgi:lysozyme family protein